MAGLKYNATTGKYESKTPVTGQGTQSRPANPRATATPARTSAPTTATPTPTPSGSRRPAAGPPSPVTGAYPTVAKPTQTYEQIINKINDGAKAYFEDVGSYPTSSWYELQMLPITIKMDADAAAVKKATAGIDQLQPIGIPI